MAYTINLTQGSKTLDLNDDTAYSCNFDDISIGQTPPRNLWHVPDDGERRLVRATEEDRTASIGLWVRGSTNDAAVDNIQTLRRWAREAYRYELTGDNDPVYLKIQRDGTTNATQHLIKTMEVDDHAAHYSADKIARQDAPNTRLIMTLAPYGEATAAISLQNDMKSSPHFIEWSSGTSHPAYADGWIAFGSPATADKSSNTYLIGGGSQRITTNATATSEGIKSDQISCSGSQDVMGYAWINHVSGDDVTVDLADDVGVVSGSAKVLSSGDSGGVSDKTAAGANSSTWYRVVVSGTTDVSATLVRIRVFRANTSGSTATTFRSDGCYMELGTTTAPDAWCSTSAIENRNDVTSANEERIHYIDIWGVPGDAPAVMQTEVDWTATSSLERRLYVGRSVDGKILAADEKHWIESDELTVSIATNGTWSAGTGTSDNHFFRFTDGGGGAPYGTGYKGISLTGTDAQNTITTPKHVYGLCRASSTSCRFHMTVFSGTGTIITSPLVTPPTASVWFLADFGPLNLSGFLPDVDSPAITLRVNVDAVSVDAATMDIDAVILFPTEEWIITRSSAIVFETDTTTYFRGAYQDVISNDVSLSADYGHETFGSLWHVTPGNLMNRIIMAVDFNSYQYDLASAATIIPAITPRTRHLLGT